MIRTRTLATLAALSVLAGSLAGCSSDPKAPSMPSTRQGRFLALVRAAGPASVTGHPDAVVVQTGRDVCSALARGNDYNQVVSVFESQRFTAVQATVFVGAAVPAFCPRYLPLLPKS